VPPLRTSLTRFHGVFAPGAKLRPFLFPQACAEETGVTPQAAARKEPIRRGLRDWTLAGLLRRPFSLNVLACAWCGGWRRGLAYLTAPDGVRASVEHLALPLRPAQLAPTQGSPQQAWC
jgi:hypothetical protein